MGTKTINYLNRDYDSLREELLARIPQLTSKWTDYNSSDLGIVLLELFCGIGDMLSYYIDAQAAECFLPTARQRQSIIDLCRLIGYKLDSPIASLVDIEFTLSTSVDSDIVIPAKTICQAILDEDIIEFEIVDDTILPKGNKSILVSARQGTRKNEVFAGTGEAFQEIKLETEAIAQKSIGIKINGIEWQEVDHFQDSDPTSLHFVIDTDALDITTISFGDGLHGAIPNLDHSIEVEWLETLGEKGNLGPDTITELASPIYLNGEQVSFTIRNPKGSSGGAFSESIEHARKQAPAELRSLWKAVTIGDYKALVEGFPGISKAVVLDTNDCQNIRYYTVHIAIAPHGGGYPSLQLKKELLAYLDKRKVVTIDIRLFDPMYRPINIDAEVFHWPNESSQLVKSRVEMQLSDFFKFSNTNFAQSIYASDIIALIDGTRGVSHVNLFTPVHEIILKKNEIPVLGVVNLTMRKADR